MSDSNLDLSTIDMFLEDPNAMFDLMIKSKNFELADYGKYIMFRSEIGISIYLMEDGNLLGLCHSRPIRDGDLRIIKLEWAVLPEHRGKGIAVKLAKETIDQMAKWGIQMKKSFNLVEADVPPDNIHSQKVATDIGLNLARKYEHKGKKYLVYMDVIKYE